MPIALDLSCLPPRQTLPEPTYFKFPSMAPVPHVMEGNGIMEIPIICYLEMKLFVTFINVTAYFMD